MAPNDQSHDRDHRDSILSPSEEHKRNGRGRNPGGDARCRDVAACQKHHCKNRQCGKREPSAQPQQYTERGGDTLAAFEPEYTGYR